MKVYKGLNLYLASFLIPLILLSAIAISLHLTPFGEKNLMVSDLGAQYSAFFAYFKDLVQGQANPFYSFSIGLGDDTFALVAYYLLSPFNFLFVLGRTSNLDNLLSIVIGLKISAISPALLFYLHRTYNKLELPQLFFALSYSFCGFTTLYLTNLMWLDALILLPLVIWAMQSLFETGRGIAYTLLVFLTIVTNYYLGYMTCIFLVLYWFYWSAKKTKFQGLRDYWEKTRARFWSFFRYSIFGGLLSGFILIPAIQGMTETAKTHGTLAIFYPHLKFGTDILTQLGLSNNSYLTRLSQLPNIYVGLLILFLSILYFQLPFSKKDKGANLILLSLLLLSFVIQTANTIWHMMQEAAGFPYRNSYMLSFLLVLLAYEAWGKKQAFNLKMLFRTSASLILLLFLGYITSRIYPVSWWLFGVSSGLFIILPFLLLGVKKRRIFLLPLFGLLILELTFNFYRAVSPMPFGSTAAFTKEYKIIFKLARSVHNPTTMNRMISDLYWTTDYGYNQPMGNSYFGVSSYSSTLDEKLRETQVGLGMYSRNVRRISSVGLTSFTSFLLNVNFHLSKLEKTKGEPIHIIDQYAVYQPNTSSPSIGYFLPDISKIHFDLSAKRLSHLFDNQTTLAQTILKNPHFSLFSPQTPTKTGDRSWAWTASDSGQLYLNIPNNRKRALPFNLFIDGQSIKVPPYTYSGLLDLGQVRAGQQVTLSASKEFLSQDLPQGALQILSRASQDQLISTMSKETVPLSYDDMTNTFSGKVNQRTPHPLFLSIPYDRDWQVKIDGHPAKFSKTLNQSFISLNLTKGEHQLEISYFPKLFIISSAFSLLALLVFVSWEIGIRVRRRR